MKVIISRARTAIVLATLVGVARAEAPRTIAAQGRLTAPNGVAKPDGAYSIVFTLYDPANAVVWSETQTSVPVSKGLFSTSLGTVVPIPAGVSPAEKALTLGVKVGADPEMTPRLPITAAAYALAVPFVRTEATSGDPNVIEGRADNAVIAGKVGGTIGGGGRSVPTDATTANRVMDDYGTVAGGADNQAGRDPGGPFPGPYAVVGGGQGNTASGQSAVIGGGEANVAPGFWSVIGGGYHNKALYSTSMIPGGAFCVTSGYYALAAGEDAEAMHDGAFVWSDTTTVSNGGATYALPFDSVRANDFAVRATGGIRLVTAVDTTFGGPTQGQATAWLSLAPGGDDGAGKFLDTSTQAYLSTGGQWTSVSDRSAKRDIKPVSPRSILERVAAMPVSEWSYKTEPAAVRHIGPMAQDFSQAFRIGQDDRHIGTLDEGGVALAAIKGLYEMIREKDARIASLEKRLAAIEKSRQQIRK